MISEHIPELIHVDVLLLSEIKTQKAPLRLRSGALTDCEINLPFLIHQTALERFLFYLQMRIFIDNKFFR